MLKLEISQIVTHILGFLIFVWALKKWAWKPVLQVLEQRKEKIKRDLEGAEDERKKAARLLEDYESRLKEIDGLARAKIQEASHEGAKIGAEIKEEARKEAKEILDKMKVNLAQEIVKARVELRNEMVERAIQVSEKVLREKLTQDKDRELVDKFLNEMEKIK
jgi:F-type H+-transporting ATPase subunit b